MTPYYARPPKLDELDPGQHHVIEASAGTGKTYTIEHLVVDKVLREGLDIAEMLVVTFTERAAAELRGRIRGLLANLVEVAGKPAEGPPPENAWILDEVALKRLNTALLRIDQASISTIHSFCQRLLTENAFAHRRLFAQRLMDGREIFANAFRDHLRTVLATSPEYQPLLRMQLEQDQGWEESGAVATLEETLYEASRRYGRIEPKLEVERLEAALALLPKVLPAPEQVWAAYKAGKGRKRENTILSTWTATAELIGRARETSGPMRLWTLSELRELEKDLRPILETADLPFGLALLQLMDEIPPQASLLIQLLLPDLRVRVKALKESQGLYDFDDMLSVVAESLRGENGDAIVTTLRQRYKYGLIDEFQDTDPIQWEVFRRIFIDGDSESRLLVIGDPKQAIYGFRAADVETYLSARKLLCGTRIVRLQQNFRSSERMIGAYNRVLTQSPGMGKPLFANDGRITYGPDAEVSCGDPSIRLLEDGEEATAIHLLSYTVEGKSKSKSALQPPIGAFIAEEIHRLLNSDVKLQKKDSPPQALKASDIFVLTRGKADGQTVAQYLAQRGLPFAFYKQDGLFGTEEVGDLIDVLEAIDAPDAPQRRTRAWLTPFFGLTLDEVARAHEIGDEAEVVNRLRRWHELAVRRDFRTLFTALMDESGFARRVAFLGTGEAALANTLRVLDLLLDEARRRHATLGELIDRLRAWRSGTANPAMQDADIQPVETDRPAVQIMTMHASKGLEASVVFLFGGTGKGSGGKSSQPDQYRNDADERCMWFGGKAPEDVKRRVQLEQAREDERLLYVALTRAKVRMYLPMYLRDGADAALDGMYGALNTRLCNLVQEGFPPEQFTVREVKADATELPPLELPPLKGWTPPVPVSLPETLDGERTALLAQCRGTITTSYTALSRHSKKTEPDREDVTGETYTAPSAMTDALASSAVVGIFLHDSLELLPLEHVRTLPSPDVFREDPIVRSVVEPIADREGIPNEGRPRAYDILFASLRAPLQLGATLVPGIASLERVLRESEFAYPIPERGHALLGKQPRDPEVPFAVERGIVKGFIDVVFEHDGRIYLGDWKSDVLRSATPEALKAHVAYRYAWQVKVYALAVVRMLRIRDEADYERRFGGVLYLFLREMANTPEGEPARGIHFERPTWIDVRNWERMLLEHSYGLDQEVA